MDFQAFHSIFDLYTVHFKDTMQLNIWINNTDIYNRMRFLKSSKTD